MSLLLDTHTLLWWLTDDPTLTRDARRAIADGSAHVIVSAASVWEIAIKRRIGKLDAPDDLLRQLAACRMDLRPLDPHDVWLAGNLPDHHRDPFDRAIVAQALRGGLCLVTSDARLAAYGVDIIPA